MALLRHLRDMNRNNIQTLRSSLLPELSGSLGDLGTLLPLLTALTLTGSINLTTTLLFTGASNIATGILFGIPLPVQPMKAIAAVAIARKYTVEQTAAAGLGVGLCVLLLSATGLLRWFGRVIPEEVVKGIQVGAGLSLVISSGKPTLMGSLGWTTPGWSDNLIWAVFAALFLLITTQAPRVPYAMITFILGLVLATIHLHTSHSKDSAKIPHYDMLSIPFLPSGKVFGDTFFTASLGQLPLTTLNSIIAVTSLSATLLPSLPAPSPTALGYSVSLMNLISCPFGAMPACHGSGGLAAQVRFGARSGGSIIILGAVKMILGIAVAVTGGSKGVAVLDKFPRGLLGIMVIAAGVELASVGETLDDLSRSSVSSQRDAGIGPGGLTRVTGQPESVGLLGGDGSQKAKRKFTEKERKERWMVMLVTVAGLLAFGNDAVGFVAGMLWWAGLRVPDWMESRRQRRGDREHFIGFRDEDGGYGDE